MTRLRLADVADNLGMTAALGNCLLHLHSATKPMLERPQSRPTSGMIDWQAQWSHNQNQITRRLQMIEDELDKLVANDMPPLSVVAAD